jgi:hypothetical protein
MRAAETVETEVSDMRPIDNDDGQDCRMGKAATT